MQISRRTTVALLTTAALAGSATAAAVVGSAASAHTTTHAKVVLTSSLLPSEPSFPSLHGVTTDRAPWLLKSGTLRLSTNGELRAKIRGLIIPELGTAGPVTTVDASLYCAEETTPAATTPSVPLSTNGDATIDTTVKLPVLCQAPVVLINPNGISSIYIASNGFGTY